MQEQIHCGDLWDFHNISSGKFVVVPTNTTVHKGNYAVMGRGIARQASDKFKKLARSYGKKLKGDKTLDGFYVFKKRGLIMLPVKRDWRQKADRKLIEHMLQILMYTLKITPSIKEVTIPMLGCGFGGLIYEDVLPMLLIAASMYPGRIAIVVPPHRLYSLDKYRESFLPAVGGKKDRRVSLSGEFCDVEI